MCLLLRFVIRGPHGRLWTHTRLANILCLLLCSSTAGFDDDDGRTSHTHGLPLSVDISNAAAAACESGFLVC